MSKKSYSWGLNERYYIDSDGDIEGSDGESPPQTGTVPKFVAIELLRLADDVEKRQLDESSPLTREQVSDLKHGDLIRVIWSGGNGPHIYKVYRLDGVDNSLYIYAVTETEFKNNILPQDRELTGSISFIGVEKPFTRIWKV